MATKTKQSEFQDSNGDTWSDDVPEQVQEAADAYMKLLRAKNKAQEKLNAAKDECITVMKEHNCERVRIDNGAKWLRREGRDSLKTEKIKSPTAVDDDE